MIMQQQVNLSFNTFLLYVAGYVRNIVSITPSERRRLYYSLCLAMWNHTGTRFILNPFSIAIYYSSALHYFTINIVQQSIFHVALVAGSKV